MEQQATLAIGIFLIIYALIISEKIHRTILAMAGAVVMVTLGILDQETAIHHIDFNTIGLLIGMMIIVGITAETGVFKYIALKAAKMAKGKPTRILIALAVITAIVSAFLDNVTTVLLMVPVTFSITKQLRINPFPFLFTQIIASNVGGTATLIGDPPNIMIGSAVKELTFMAFINNLTPITIIIVLAYIPLFVLIFRNQIKTTPELQQSMDDTEMITDHKLLRKCLIVLGMAIVSFFLHQSFHWESATVALAGAFLLLLLTGEHMLEPAFRSVEWMTLFFFVGLFILVGGLVETGVITKLACKPLVLQAGIYLQPLC
jgi:Na+/H+ antiporter NhaD/arsenite permease-like protein